MFGCQLRLSTLIERGPQPKILKMDLLPHSNEPDNRYFGMRYTKGTQCSHAIALLKTLQVHL